MRTALQNLSCWQDKLTWSSVLILMSVANGSAVQELGPIRSAVLTVLTV